MGKQAIAQRLRSPLSAFRFLPAPFFRHGGDAAALAAAVLGPLLLYALTLPRNVVLEDDALFLMVGAHLGIAHPPGYPLYTLILYLFMQLPFGGPAFLGHLSSAVLGALACGALYLCARMLQPSRLAALAAAWLFAASEHFWSQAIIAEVYALNALLFFACYALILHGVRHPERVRAWIGAAAVYGLSLANHWPLMLLATPGLLLAALPVWRLALRRLPLLLAVFLPCAILPYAWMVWRSLQEPLISFYGPIWNWQAFLHYLSRRGYSETDASPSAGWEDRMAFLQWFGNELLWQLTLPGFALALLGLFVLLRRRRFAEAGSGLLAFLGNSVVLIGLLAFDYDYFKVAVFRPYPLVCYGIAALWLAVGLQAGLQFLMERLAGRSPVAVARRAGFRTGVAALAGPRMVMGMVVGIVMGMVAFSVQANWRINDRSDNDFAERYAELFFDILPRDALLLTFGDLDGPVSYYHFVEGRRPDLRLMHLRGLVYGNRLFSPFLDERRRHEILRWLVNGTQRPVFYLVGATRFFPHGHGVRHYGPFKEVAREEAPARLRYDVGSRAFVKEFVGGKKPAPHSWKRHPAVDRYFKELLALEPTDAWEYFCKSVFVYQYGKYLGSIALSGDVVLQERMRPLFAAAEGSYEGLTAMAWALLERGDLSHHEQIGEWLDKAERLQPRRLHKVQRAQLLLLQGTLLERQGRREAALSLFRKSAAIYPHPENEALEILKRLGSAPP